MIRPSVSSLFFVLGCLSGCAADSTDVDSQATLYGGQCAWAEYATDAGLGLAEAEEPMAPSARFRPGSSLAGFVGAGYLVATGDAAITPPSEGAKVAYRFWVPEGVHRVLLRTHVGAGNSADHPNDAWIRVSGGYTLDWSSGGAEIPLEHSANAESGWAMAYSHEPNVDWTWSTLTGQGAPIFVRGPGRITVEVAPRSSGFHLDRVALASTDLALVGSLDSDPARFREMSALHSFDSSAPTDCAATLGGEEEEEEEEPDPGPADSRPRVWVTSDLSDPTAAGANADPDDVPSLIATLLYGHRVDIRGITLDVTSENFNNGAAYVNRVLIPAYRQVQEALRRHDSAYPTADQLAGRVRSAPSRRFQAGAALAGNDPALALFEEARRATPDRPLFVLNWGALTDVAFALRHAQEHGEQIEDRVVVISHATRESYNRGLDVPAAQAVEERAQHGALRFFELGNTNSAFHSHGDWNNFRCPDGNSAGNSFEPVLESSLGTHMRPSLHGRYWDDIPWMNGQVDMSDASTLLLLLGYGGGLGPLHGAGYRDLRGIAADRLCSARPSFRRDILQYAAWSL